MPESTSSPPIPPGSGVPGQNGAQGLSSSQEAFLRASPNAQLALVLADYQAAYRVLESGGLEPYGGQFVAFLDGQFAGADPNPAELRARVSRERGVHPERLAVIHVLDEIVI